MRNVLVSFIVSAGLLVAPANAQTVGQDAKDAAHDTKTSAKKGYKKSTHATKKAYKKSTHATKKGVHKAADKVADKTT